MEDEEIKEEDVKIEEKVEDKVVIEDRIAILEKQLAETTAERDKFKKERDEANALIRNSKDNGKNEEDEFDEYFGGLKW